VHGKQRGCGCGAHTSKLARTVSAFFSIAAVLFSGSRLGGELGLDLRTHRFLLAAAIASSVTLSAMLHGLGLTEASLQFGERVL